MLFFSNEPCFHFLYLPKGGIHCTREALIRHAHCIDEIFPVNHMSTSSDGVFLVIAFAHQLRFDCTFADTESLRDLPNAEACYVL